MDSKKWENKINARKINKQKIELLLLCVFSLQLIFHTILCIFNQAGERTTPALNEGGNPREGPRRWIRRQAVCQTLKVGHSAVLHPTSQSLMFTRRT